MIGALDHVRFHICCSWHCEEFVGIDGLAIGRPDLKLACFEVKTRDTHSIVRDRAINNDPTV